MRKQADLLFQVVSLATLVIALGALAALVFDLLSDGASRLSWQFLTNIASRNADEAGVYHALMGMGQSVLAGAATLALLALPVVILSTREALRTVPSSIREGSYALGATKWQTIWNQVLPMALPGVLTGLILALSRAIGETAPLITIGALTYIPFAPDSVWSKFTVLPIQVFNWVSRPQAEFKTNAAAGILVLLALLLSMNAIAIVVRDRHQRQERV